MKGVPVDYEVFRVIVAGTRDFNDYLSVRVIEYHGKN